VTASPANPSQDVELLIQADMLPIVPRDVTAAEPSESAAVSASASRRLEQLDQIPGGVDEQDL
jgi:hypothetical protein